MSIQFDMIIQFICRAILLGVPLLYGSTGEIITEKSGHLNLGIPGIMYVGAISGVVGSFLYENACGNDIAKMNVALAIFNLIPVPPFDGSRIAFAILPDRYYFGIMKYERIIMLVFLVAFMVFGDGFSYFVSGVFNGVYGALSFLTSFLV